MPFLQEAGVTVFVCFQEKMGLNIPLTRFANASEVRNPGAAGFIDVSFPEF